MTTNTNSKGKATLADLAASLAVGAQKHFPAGSSLTVGGALLTVVQIDAQLSGYATLRTAVDTARAALQAKVAAENAQSAAERAFIGAFVRIVRGSFGNQPDVLADFGLQAEKTRTPLTVEQQVAAAAKREATRAARGTMGSKAKQAIKGNVIGVVVTPVTGPQPAAASGTGGTSAPSATATTPAHS
jgi:hypothetical protein